MTTGQTATIGFWQNENRQELIESLNKDGDADADKVAGLGLEGKVQPWFRCTTHVSTLLS